MTKKKMMQCALRKSASAGTRRQCSYSDFISLLEVVGVKSQQAIQHAATGHPSRARVLSVFALHSALPSHSLPCVCVCVWGGPQQRQTFMPVSHRDEYFNRHVASQSRKSLLIPPTMSDILRQLYGLYQRSTCTCIQ